MTNVNISLNSGGNISQLKEVEANKKLEVEQKKHLSGNTNFAKDRNLPPVNAYQGQPIKPDIPRVFSGGKSPKKSSEGKIAVIDNFKTRIDADYDEKEDNISHGGLVASFLGGANIEKINNGEEKKFNENLQAVIDKIKAGEKISVVNISQSYKVPIEMLASITKLDMKAENIRGKSTELYNKFKEMSEVYDKSGKEVLAKYRNELTEKMKSVKQDTPEYKKVESELEVVDFVENNYKMAKEMSGFYDKVNTLAELGVPVVISAGNKEEDDIGVLGDRINLLTLNPRVISVGGTENLAERSGKNKKQYLAGSEELFHDNSLVDVHVQGVYLPDELNPEVLDKLSYVPKVVKKAKRDPLSFQGKIKGKVIGTSFSAPVVSKYVKQLKDKGLNVDEINTALMKAQEQAMKNNTPVEEEIEKIIK